MLKSVGCEYVLVGHSERRAIFGDSDGEINHIVERIQEANMIPVLCIGETKEEYELGLNEEICTLQLSKDLKGLSKEAKQEWFIKNKDTCQQYTKKVFDDAVAEQRAKHIQIEHLHGVLHNVHIVHAQPQELLESYPRARRRFLLFLV